MTQLSVIICQIQKGDESLREEFIAKQKEFIRSYASFVCRRELDWNNDDELSVALLAFNRAIDTFNPVDRGNFLTYARVLIRNSLVDYFRSQQMRREMEKCIATDKSAGHSETAASLRRYAIDADNMDLAYEIGLFKEILGGYGLTLETLVKHSPRHRDTRENLKKIALQVARDKELRERVLREKKIPLKEIQSRCGTHRKLLEKWRKYLLSLLIIAAHEELEMLAEYIWGKEPTVRQ